MSATTTQLRFTYLITLVMTRSKVPSDKPYTLTVRISCSAASPTRIVLGEPEMTLITGTKDQCQSFACGFFGRNMMWAATALDGSRYTSEFEVDSYI